MRRRSHARNRNLPVTEYRGVTLSYSVGRRNLASKASASRSEALVFLSHGVLAVHPLEAANGEMAARHLLEMLDEGVVHGRPTDCADDRNGLRRELLRDHRPEAGRDLRDEANQQRAAFLQDTAFRDEAPRMRDALCQHAAHDKISALERVCRARPATQGEHL